MKYLILMMCFTFGLYSQSTLDEYLEYGAENNPMLKAKFNEYMAVVQQIEQVDNLPEPQIAFGYFISPVETRVGAQQFKVSLRQKFPWFGKLDARSDVIAEKAKEKLKEFETIKFKLFFDIKKEWLNLYLRSKEIDLIEKQIVNYNSLREISDIRYKNSKSGLSEILRIKQKLDDFSNKKLEIYNQLKVLRSNMNALLNRTDSAEVVVSDSLNNSFDDVNIVSIDSVYKNNSELLEMAQRKKTFESEINATQLEKYPDISVSLDYTAISPRNDVNITDNGKDAFMPMLSVNIPIFNNKYDAKIQELMYKNDVVDNKITNKKNILSKEYIKILNDLADAKRNIDHYRKQIQKSKDVLAILYTEYSNNKDKFSEILTEQENIYVYEYRLEKEKVRAELALAYLNMINSKM